jgi:hypothetical protein
VGDTMNLNVTDPVALRRTLLELEQGLLIVDTPLQVVPRLNYVEGTTTLKDLYDSVEDIRKAVNAISVLINSKRRNNY